MRGRLADKIALVTGGAGGIGWGIVERFLEEGAQVLVADIDEARLRQAEERARSLGRHEQILLQPCDATREEDVAGAIESVIRRFGRLDCMVNNAGGPGPSLGSIVDTPPAHFDTTIALTLRSAYLGIHLAAGQLLKQRSGGVILSIGSISATIGGAGPPVYGAAKAALVRLSQDAAAELAPHGIRVNTISPGLILTPASESNGGRPEQLATFQPLAMTGRPQDVGDAAVFLASDEARFAAGADLVLDGAAKAQGIDLYRRLMG